MSKNQIHPQVEPTILVIFGASGELASERLIPALFHLFDHRLLPKNFTVIGFSRRHFAHQQFRNRVKVEHRNWDKFAKSVYYQSGNFTNPADFHTLAQHLNSLEKRGHSCANRLFYFATLPTHYATISEELEKSGLLIGCKVHKRQVRVLVEKPFGFDFRSARKLDATLGKYFREEQIYRIDHYLGKETVQNIFATRFANSIFEPIWNRNFIDHVQISTLEEVGVNNRGAYYEQVGALKDMVQSHLLQLLATIAMEPPASLSTPAIRAERARTIEAIRKPLGRDLENYLVIGQYQGYRGEPNVSPRSKVETFVATRLFIDNLRWTGVPFYLRTGQMLQTKTTTISLHFKPTTFRLFRGHTIKPNVLTFQIQPDEGVFLNLMAKYPGFGIRLHPATLTMGYDLFQAPEIPDAHERLLLDFMQGDQRLFAATPEVEAAWKYVDALENYLSRPRRLLTYPAGSLGPKEAEALIQRDKRKWLTL